MKNFVSKLKFRDVMIILVGIVFLLFILSTFIPQTIQDVINGGSKTTFDETGYAPDTVQNLPEGMSDEGDAQNIEVQGNGNRSILDAMPYLGEKFTVTYQEGLDQFDVNIDPIYGATEQDVYDWFGSFKTVPDLHKLNIVFHFSLEKGAPSGT